MTTPGEKALRHARTLRLRELEAEIPRLEEVLKAYKAEHRRLSKEDNTSNGCATDSPPTLESSRFATASDNAQQQGDS